MRHAVFFACAVVAPCGCGKREAPRASATASASVSRPVASASAPSAVAPLDEPVVRRMLDAWLAAQNGSNFAAYEALYGERFTGVKRSGSTTRNFGRAGWLADRKAMFQKPMEVAADEVAITLTGAGARVTFEQAWSSGSYSDRGPKQMVLVATPGGGPRIVREEMLSSTIEGAPIATPVESLVLADEDGLVLSLRPEETWKKGAVAPGREEQIAIAAVDETALPPEVKRWKGRKVRAVTSTGATCAATVSSFVLRASVVPHFGMLDDWRGRSGRPGLAKNELAAEIWKLAENGGKSLVGVLSPPCDALWAVDAEEGIPAPGKIAPAPDDLKKLGVEAVRKLPDYVVRQKAYLAEVSGAKGFWDEMRDAEVRAFTMELRAHPRLLMVTAQAMEGGCDEFTGVINVVFEMGPGNNPKLKLLGVLDPPNGTNWTPESAFDLDGDGTLEVLLGGGFGRTRALFTKGAKGYALRTLFEEPYFDCPC